MFSYSPPIQELIPARTRDLGDGFSVRRILPAGRRQAVGPFIFLDHFGPIDFLPGQGMDVRPHPHIGLATISYLFEGRVIHRDHLGSVQMIHPGDLAWMMEGSGIVHSERTPEEDRDQTRSMEGLQIWFALPPELETCQPNFFHHPAESIPVISDELCQLKVLLGSAFGLCSPVSLPEEAICVIMDLKDSAVISFPCPYRELGIYVQRGQLNLENKKTGEVQGVASNHLAIFSGDIPINFRSEGPTRAVLLGGMPLEKKRHIWWNFISTNPKLIEQAKDRWRNNEFGQIYGEKERILLPEV